MALLSFAIRPATRQRIESGFDLLKYFSIYVRHNGPRRLAIRGSARHTSAGLRYKEGVTFPPKPFPSVPSSPAPAPPAQLSAEHLQQLQTAKNAIKKIHRAARTAGIDGWTLAIFAVFSLLFGFDSFLGILTAMALGTIAYFELQGAAQLRRLQIAAIRMLVINQIALGLLICVYGLGCLHAEMTGPGVYQSLVSADPDSASALGQFEGPAHQIAMLFYVLLIVSGIAGPGALALYYRSREKYLQIYLTQTPQWILTMQQAGLTL